MVPYSKHRVAIGGLEGRKIGVWSRLRIIRQAARLVEAKHTQLVAKRRIVGLA